MSNIVNRQAKRIRRIFRPEKPAQPEITIPGEPSIDEAAKNRSELDRIRKRRGVLANVFGGKTASSTPTVATKKLLGE